MEYQRRPETINAKLCKGFEKIHTSEGYEKARPGDYIITGANGDRYPCKPRIFKALYERAEE